MADSNLMQTVISGVLSGGGTALATLLTAFRDSKKRVAALEAQMGVNEDPKTGIYSLIERADEGTKKLKREYEGFKREVEAWAEDPPDWLTRAINRAQRTNVGARLTRIEERLEELEKVTTEFVERPEYERDARVRSEELAKIREQLATSNGLLRGVMGALGYIDSDGRKRG